MQKVWHRDFDSWWYATVRESGTRKQHRLIKGPNTPEHRKLAEKELIRILADHQGHEELADTPTWITVDHVITGFLTHSSHEHDQTSYRWYKTMLHDFNERFGHLRIRQLRKRHVKYWVKKKAYNPTSANKFIGAVKRAFNWAVEEEHIAKSPIAHVRKPKPLARQRILDPGERELILNSIRDQAFKDFVTALQTGARPGEIARVSAAEVFIEQGMWILEKHKTAKKTGKPRVIYLTPPMIVLTRKLMAKNPEGRLFLNRNRKPWTKNAIRLRFKRLRERFPQLKGVVAYTFRHSFATDALERGVPDADVAELMGHEGTEMLHAYYSKLSQKRAHLQEAARRATGVEDAALPSAP